MDQSTGALRPSGSVSWQARLAGYRPQGITPNRWAQALPFVAGCVERLDADDGPGVRRVVRVLGRLSAWALAEGLPLDPEVVLEPDTVERFVALGLANLDPRERLFQ